MSNTKTKILDLIPDSLKPQLMLEVGELLEENRKKEQQKKNPTEEQPTEEQINELIKTMM